MMEENIEMERPPKMNFGERVKYVLKMLLGTFIIVGVAVNFASILARYVFLAPLFWAEHVITYLLMWSVFIGAAIVVWDERHLNMDILCAVFPRRWKALLRAISSIGMVVVLGIMIPYSWEVAATIFMTDQRTAVGEFPLVIPHTALAVGFTLMASAAIYRVFTSIRELFTPDSVAQHHAPVYTSDSRH